MSTPIDDGGPAFPCDSIQQFPTQGGMSLRDWFAGQALAGDCANPAYAKASAEQSAECAYKAADAMLAARKGKTP